MSPLARLATTVGLLAAVVLILAGSFFASGPLLLALVWIFHVHPTLQILMLGAVTRAAILILVSIALVSLILLSGRHRSETLRRLEWRFTAGAGVLAAVLLGKLLLTPVGTSESTSLSIDSQGHSHSVTHSTATYLLQPDVGGIMLGLVVAAAALLLIGAIAFLAYRDWRSGRSSNASMLWIIAVVFEGATVVTGFSIGFWFLAVPPLLMLGALAGSLAGTPQAPPPLALTAP